MFDLKYLPLLLVVCVAGSAVGWLAAVWWSGYVQSKSREFKDSSLS